MPKNSATPAATRGKPGLQRSHPARTMASAKVAARKRSAEPQPASAKTAPEQRQQLIAQAAYFIAERRGFAPGNELEDWLQAEAEIEAWMKAALQ
ncbi:MAG: DUF2934 domain-containing protein [Pseudomonadota bacterium]